MIKQRVRVTIKIKNKTKPLTKAIPKKIKEPKSRDVYDVTNIDSCPFEAWDNNGRYFQDYKYKLGIAEKLGYTYLSEAICKLYLLHEYSFNDIGELIGVKQSAIHYRLKRWGVYRRHAGGATHFTKTYQYRHLLWELAIGWKGTKKALYREAASQFQLNVNTVQAFYRQRRWEDFQE